MSRFELDKACALKRMKMRRVELAPLLTAAGHIFAFALRSGAHGAENVVVVLRARLVVLGFLLPGVCLAGAAQNQRPGAGVGSTASIRAVSPENRVDINTATLGDLLKIPGITRVWADRIVRFRPYRTKADLEEQGVVPVELYTRIKDSIVAHRPKQ